MDAASAYAIFKEINTKPVVTAFSVYWEALDAERLGHITVAEMDAIAVYHKDAIAKLAEEDLACEEAEAKEMIAVHKAQSDYWADFEAGLL
jgi:hypothetical protein